MLVRLQFFVMYITLILSFIQSPATTQLVGLTCSYRRHLRSTPSIQKRMQLWVICHQKWFMFNQISSEYYSHLRLQNNLL
jgi:hypothetical protein